jgi:hypothetical protein
MRSPARAALAAVLLASAYPFAIGAQPAPAPMPEPAPATASPASPPAPPTAAPLPSPAPPSSSPSPSPSPIAAPTAAPTQSPYHFITTPPAPPAGQPAILEIDMLDQTLHAGAPYSVRVKTTADVTAINVSAMGETYGMQGAAPGLFASDGQVPSGIPFFLLNRDYTVTVTALTADKRTTSVSLTLHLQR